jgi:hypothetical protein
LAIAEFLSSLEVACAARGDIEVFREQDILAVSPVSPVATRAAREPLRFAVDKTVMARRQHYSVVPDGLFGLRFPDDTGAYFMLEVDRGTIPITRSDVKGTSVWQKSIVFKLATYYEAWRAGRHVEQFGIKQMRVLFVTESAERVRNMLAALDQVTEGRGSNFFLFIDRPTLGASNPLDVEWVSGKRAAVKLTD